MVLIAFNLALGHQHFGLSVDKHIRYEIFAALYDVG